MSDQIKVDTSIPIPRGRRGRVAKFPFGLMNVGDSMFHDKDTIFGCAISWALRQRNDWKFTSRKEGNGVRIWRIK